MPRIRPEHLLDSIAVVRVPGLQALHLRFQAPQPCGRVAPRLLALVQGGAQLVFCAPQPFLRALQRALVCFAALQLEILPKISR